MTEVLEKMQKIGLVPVVALEDVKQAAPLANALCEGGLPCAEVTFRTEAAEESIRIMSREFPEMLIGAGTVLTPEQADRAIDAGAKFIVSPGLNPKVVKRCLERGVDVTPGTANPSDVEQAIEMGLEVVKFFPAEAAGGLDMIQSMAAPYHKIKFMPTGGINASNLGRYLAYPKVLACGGSWMVKGELLKAGNFDEITKLTKEAVETMLGLEIMHIQIPGGQIHAPLLDSLLGFGGGEGEILVGVNQLKRAKDYLEMRGVEFEEDKNEDQDGGMQSVGLKHPAGEYRVRLVEKVKKERKE